MIERPNRNPRRSPIERPRSNALLIPWFAVYLLGVAGLFLFLPQLAGRPYWMPWNYSWIFLLITPAVAAVPLGWAVATGRIGGGPALVFLLMAAAVGMGLICFSAGLSGVV